MSPFAAAKMAPQLSLVAMQNKLHVWSNQLGMCASGANVMPMSCMLFKRLQACGKPQGKGMHGPSNMLLVWLIQHM
jgi:hypothetical protein